MTGMGQGWGRHWGSDWGAGFGGEGRGRGGPGRRGPGGRGRMFGSGELRLALLGLIAESPRHGYELIKAIEELSGGNYAPSPGVVYPTLSLLTDEGVIEDQAGEGARKSFAATDAGRSELAGRHEEYDAIVARLKGLAEESERTSAPPLKRAMGNLFHAVKDRMASGDFNRETVHGIAEILDEAARKIERL
ncbi:MAG: PadR family transcriptional regulator [Pseudomonadota bacterium]|nr:PadR family transcriptional regulator [Pseudomonadota bacterium]